MCYKYVNAVNRYAAEGNKKTKTSPILKGVKAVFTREIHLSRETVQDFVSEASKCDFDVDLGYNRIVVDAKSIMGIFSIDLTRTLCLKVHSDNADECEEIKDMIKRFIVED